MNARTLQLTVWRGGAQIGPVLTVLADPEDAAWMRDHLVAAMRREGWPEDRIEEFVMEVREHGRRLCTFAATERTS